MKIFNVIQEKTRLNFNLFDNHNSKIKKLDKITKKSRKTKVKSSIINQQKLELLAMKQLNTSLIVNNKSDDYIIKSALLCKQKHEDQHSINPFVDIFNRINTNISQYRHLKKRYSISSTYSISVSDLNKNKF